MRFDGPPSRAIRRRRSVRTYSTEPIDVDVVEELKEACSSLYRAPFGERASFSLVQKPSKKDVPVKLGDYGLMKNPRNFLIGDIAPSPTALEGYGYLMEHLVLRATDLGMGTCWMGYFNQEYFADVPLREGHLRPAIVVLGVSEGKRLFERITRAAIKADRRRAWEDLFFEGSFDTPMSRQGAGEMAGPLEMLRLAPSSGNTQPWRVVRDDGALHLHLHKVKDAYYRRGIHHVDIGIAMAHLELGAREAGLDGEWRLADPGLDPPDGTEYRVSWFGN
jgi:nitroreductase